MKKIKKEKIILYQHLFLDPLDNLKFSEITDRPWKKVSISATGGHHPTECTYLGSKNVTKLYLNNLIKTN